MINQIVGKHAKTKNLESNILQISQEAKAMKAKYQNVIDATVGMLHHEKGGVFKFSVVEDLLHNLSDAEIYHYAPVRGTKSFSDGVFNWVFGENKQLFRDNFHYSIIPTTGGSAAISNSFYNFNDFGQQILIANHYWTPYENFAFEANVGLYLYEMYDANNNFNISDFKEKALELAKKQKRLTVLINDPCNNPTGLCMSMDDWKQVILTLNNVANEGIPVVLIHDIAYLDYQMEDKTSRDVFNNYFDLHPNILAVVVFSGSKTFSMYGFRIGAQIGISKSQDVIDQFIRVGDYSVRGRFSSASQPGMNIIGSIFTKEENLNRFNNELLDARKLLKIRSKLFIDEAKKHNLAILPYSGGFFISVLTNNKQIFSDLVKERVFVIQMKNLIRIAISSLKLTEIPRLVQILKKHI